MQAFGVGPIDIKIKHSLWYMQYGMLLEMISTALQQVLLPQCQYILYFAYINI